MSNVFKGLKPEKLWSYFYEICQVPRPSKKEEKISAYIQGVAKKLKLECLVDETGNILIRKPATKGYEKSPTVVLQSHIDMVCEKNNDTKHNFDKDPIVPRIDGEWVKATGTTLGADDGIGIATQLAILDSSDIAHGPLEMLFTVDEETGLTGAFGLKPGFLKGNILLNLDSEDEGELFIGCAGGQDTRIEIKYKTETSDMAMDAMEIKVTGLKGGHSGDDINKGLGNAVKIINRLLWNLFNDYKIRLSKLEGGNLRNAIAREASAIIVFDKKFKNEISQAVKSFCISMQDDLKITEPELKITGKSVSIPKTVIDLPTQKKILNALYACPHGVIKMSAAMANFVETSTNLASVKMKDGAFQIGTSQRSSSDFGKKDVVDMVESVFKLTGGKIMHDDGYPGWLPNPNSPILDTTRAAYKKLFKKEPKVLAIHAGLECGLIGETYPQMDMISYGPTIKGAHSPDERLEIKTVQMFWDLTLEVLKNIPR